MARVHLPEGGEGLFEFTGIKFLVSVEVHAVEDDPEGADSDTTLLLDGQLELKVKFADHNILIDTVESHRATKSSIKINYDSQSPLFNFEQN